MRLVLFIDSLNNGGAQRQFVLLAEGLARRGHQVVFVSLHPTGHYWDWLIGKARCEVRSLYDRRGGSTAHRVAQLIGAPRRLAAILRDERADVLYSALHTSDLLGWIATRIQSRVPVAWSIRTARQQLPWKQRPFYELCRLVSAQVPLMIANSDAGLEDFLSCGFRPRATAVVPNGIDVEVFRPDDEARRRTRAEWDVADQHQLIGMVGRLAAVKNHPAFLQAAATVAPRYPNARFVCVGDGPVDYRAILEGQAAALGLSDRLIWAGARYDMDAVYNALDLFCLSSHAEGFPNVLAEAMASAVPCVAVDVGDVVDILGSNGCALPTGDPAALGSGMAALLDQPLEARRRLGAECRARIVEYYSIDAMIDGTEYWLSRVIDGDAAALATVPSPHRSVFRP